MPNNQTAVTVVEQSAGAVVEWNLDDFPTDRFNRLIPTQTIQMPTDLFRPVVQVVQLDPNPNAGDVYQSHDTPPGHAAPTRVALRKFATAAGISFVDERRTDDGTNPDVIEVSTVAEMLLPTGQRIRATGTKRIDLEAQKWSSPDHRKKYRSFFFEHVASRAQNRAIRALLSLRGSYPLEVYQRPFAVVSFAPNYSHPDVRARVLDGIAPATEALYGGPAAKQLAAGKPPVVDVSPAPEDDAAPDQPAEPSWMAELPHAAEPAATVDLAKRLRDNAEASSMTGDATEPQRARIKDLLGPLGGPAIAEGMVYVWPEGEDGQRPRILSVMSAAQAAAILAVAESMASPNDFHAAWGALVEQARAAT